MPRWRPLVAVESRDLGSVGRFEQIASRIRSADFSDDLQIWREGGSLADAVDIFDTYVVTGDRNLLAQAVALFKNHAEKLSPKLKDAIALEFREAPDPLVIRRNIAQSEQSVTYVQRSIAILKRRLIEYPRDALSYLEMARLYAVLGQYGKSEENLHFARYLAPNNRVIIRATLQLHDVTETLGDGLKVVRNSDLLRFDPWIQSAEVAAATILGKSSKYSNRSQIKFGSDGSILRSSTELAMATATLERASGMKERKVFQLVGQALPHSTENGFAQAVWLSHRSSREFHNRFPDSHPTIEAYEAKVDLAFRERDFESAATCAELWMADQPFSADAIVRLLNLRSVQTEPNEITTACAKRALLTHGDNWHVLNACVLALVEGRALTEAKVALKKLEREAPDGAMQAFVHAARGLLAFAIGDFPSGRRDYERAAAIAREGRAADLSVNAVIFWLRCEIRNGLVSRHFAIELAESIENALGRLRHPDKDFIHGAWWPVKKLIENLGMEHEEIESPLVEGSMRYAANEILTSPTLFDGV